MAANLSGKPQERLEEAAWRFNNMRTQVSETADGLEIRFVCCGHVERFTKHGDPQAIGETITAHITKPCQPQLPALNWCGNPRAATMADTLTYPQQVAIRGIANAKGYNAEAVSLEVFKCELTQLSGKAASALIGYLKALPDRQRF
jgi:hypothetical protein